MTEPTPGASAPSPSERCECTAPSLQQRLLTTSRDLSRAHALLVLLSRADLEPATDDTGAVILDEAVLQSALEAIAGLVQQAWNQVDLARSCAQTGRALSPKPSATEGREA